MPRWGGAEEQRSQGLLGCLGSFQGSLLKAFTNKGSIAGQRLPLNTLLLAQATSMPLPAYPNSFGN